MNQQERILKIKTFISSLETVEATLDKLNTILSCSPESELHTAVYNMIDAYMESLCDNHAEKEWLSWFIWDNECGKRGLEAGICEGEMSVISTVEQLVELMMSDTTESP